MLNIRIRDNIVVVDEKPYSVSEMFIHGRATGFVKLSKSAGLTGDLSVEASRFTYEYPGVIIIGEPFKPLSYKIEVVEDRKGLLIRTPSKLHSGMYEVNVVLENARVAMMVLPTSRRLLMYVHGASVQTREKFMVLEISVRALEEPVEAKVTRVFLE
ncbi:MAG: hypothetical protein QXP67_02990 [Desulfurococcaceae archaeon]